MDFYNALSKLNLGAFRTSRKLPLFGSVSRESEAAIHFHNPLSRLKLGAFRASRKLPLFGFVFRESGPAIHFPNPLSQFKLGAFRTSRKLPLFGFVFAASEAAVHFHNPLSQFKLGAFETSRKLGLFVQVGIFWVARCGLRVSSCGLRVAFWVPGLRVQGSSPWGSSLRSGILASLREIGFVCTNEVVLCPASCVLRGEYGSRACGSNFFLGPRSESGVSATLEFI